TLMCCRLTVLVFTVPAGCYTIHGTATTDVCTHTLLVLRPHRHGHQRPVGGTFPLFTRQVLKLTPSFVRCSSLPQRRCPSSLSPSGADMRDLPLTRLIL
ncbi:uncharacterized protein F5147DRAFT_706518, partial [Suillus discolor]